MRVEKDLRPISLTLMLSKGLEWYARDFKMDVIEDLIDTHQYGSVQGQLNSAGTCRAYTLLACCSRTKWKSHENSPAGFQKIF